MNLSELWGSFRSITQARWQELFSQRVEAVRLWVQESPELGTAAGFLIGFIVALALKQFVIFLLVMAALAGAVYFFAPHE